MKNISLISENALLMSSVFGSSFFCEQMFSSGENVKSRTRRRLTHDHWEREIPVVTEIETDISILLKKSRVEDLAQ